MSCILHIETSTEACSVAVSEDGLAVFSKEDLKGPSHAVQLGVFVDEAYLCRQSWYAVGCSGCELRARLVHRAAYWCFLWRRVFAMDVICHLSVCRHWRCCVCRCCYIMICLRMPALSYDRRTSHGSLCSCFMTAHWA